ncbi:MAG: acyloxyacyl hydrolase, partial [Bacteroidaceae bacterium]|nr:acyloxyacyl hydrolase [Bacteroidaceae bacterium]
MKKIFSYWGFRVICILLFCLYLCPSRTSAQAIEAGYGKGEVLKFDNWLNKEGALKQQDAQSFWLGYIYQTHADEHCAYASDYNYPTLTFGLLVSDFNKVRLRYNPYGTRPIDYDSRCGTSFVLYGSFRRAFFRTQSGWSADYTFSNGIGYNTHIYNRFTNVDNVMLGSRLSVYFDVAFALNYRYRQCEFFVGPEFRHLSNGGTVRPNKGINKLGVGTGV